MLAEYKQQLSGKRDVTRAKVSCADTAAWQLEGKMDFSKVVYICSSRLPTEKAYGVRTVHMATALAALTGSCTLLHPKPHKSYQVKQTSLAEYYQTPANFIDAPLPLTDFPYYAKRFLPFAENLSFRLKRFLWTSIAALHCKRHKSSLHFTQEPLQAWFLTLLGLPTCLELHHIPKKRETFYMQRFIKSSSCAGVTTLTTAMRRIIAQQYKMSEENICLTPSALDISPYTELLPQASARNQLHLPEDEFIIGYVGRFLSLGNEKGIPEIIEAAALMTSRTKPPIVLCVGGPLEQESKYRAIADRCGFPQDRLLIKGYVPHHEVPVWLAACDVLPISWTSTSYSATSTSPLKMFEYMASGVPIIASDLDSLRDFLSSDNAAIVPAGDCEALANAFEYVQQHPKETKKKALLAREAVMRCCTWKNRAITMLEFAHNTLQSGRKKLSTDSQNVPARTAMLGSHVYSRPLDSTSAQKFFLMTKQESLYVVGQSGSMAFRRFTEHACFILIPRLPLPLTGFLSIQFFSPLILLWLIFFRNITCIVAQSAYEGCPALLAKNIAALFGKKVSLVVESHGDFEKAIFFSRKMRFKNIYRRVISFLADRSLKNADMLRAVSSATATQLKTWAPATPVVVYPAWMHLVPFFEAGMTAARSRTILFAGDITFGKGVDLLIKAFTEIHSSMPDAQLKLAGRETNRDFSQALKEQISKCNLTQHIKFLGMLPVDKLAHEMASAQVVVLPSRSEGLGRVLVEALAAGTPIVCTDVGGMPDVAADCPAARVVPSENSAALAEAVRFFMHGPQPAELREICRKRAQQIFTPQAYVTAMFDVCRQARQRAGVTDRGTGA